MTKKQISEFKPFFSILIFVATLFAIAFMKTEVRRMGYHMLKQVKVYKTLQDDQTLTKLDYAQFTSPSYLREVARVKLTLGEARMGQIIQLSGHRIALKQ